MAHIRKKGPSWVVDYRDTRGKGRSKSFRTKAEARRFEAAVETAKNRGEWTDPKGARTPFTEWADRYLETCPNLGTRRWPAPRASCAATCGQGSRERPLERSSLYTFRAGSTISTRGVCRPRP